MAIAHQYIAPYDDHHDIYVHIWSYMINIYDDNNIDSDDKEEDWKTHFMGSSHFISISAEVEKAKHTFVLI